MTWTSSRALLTSKFQDLIRCMRIILIPPSKKIFKSLSSWKVLINASKRNLINKRNKSYRMLQMTQIKCFRKIAKNHKEEMVQIWVSLHSPPKLGASLTPMPSKWPLVVVTKAGTTQTWKARTRTSWLRLFLLKPAQQCQVLTSTAIIRRTSCQKQRWRSLLRALLQ